MSKVIESTKQARSLAESIRGQYVIGQALAIAYKALVNAPHPYRETSNAEDMRLIGLLFEPFFSMEMGRDRPVLTDLSPVQKQQRKAVS